MHDRVKGNVQPFVYLYKGIINQCKLGKLEYWSWILDSLDSVILRPYIHCEPWLENARVLPLILQSRYLINRTPFIIEI